MRAGSPRCSAPRGGVISGRILVRLQPGSIGPGRLMPPLSQRRGHRGDADGAVVLDEAIRRVVGQVHAEVVIEAARRRAVGDGLVKSTLPRPSAGGWLAVFGRPVPAEVPFADAGGGVAVLAQQGRKGEPALPSISGSPHGGSTPVLSRERKQ